MRLDPVGGDDSVRAGCSDRCAQERRLLEVGFDQREAGLPPLLRSDGNDEPREAGAAAEIDPFAEVRRMIEELQAVGDMPDPEVAERAARNEIVRALPCLQELNEALQVAANDLRCEREAGERIGPGGCVRQRFVRPCPVSA